MFSTHASAETLGKFSDHSKDVKEAIENANLVRSSPNLSHRQENDPDEKIFEKNETIFFASKGVDRFEKPYDVLFSQSSTGGIIVDSKRHAVQHHSDRLEGHPKKLTQFSYSIDEPAVQAITVSWTDINVKVKDDGWNKKMKQFSFFKQRKDYQKFGHKPVRILKNVNGVASPGRLLAIMGASGSGKTTLLNVLTHRNIGQFSVEGQVRINGRAIGSQIRTIAAYVQQDDLFVGTLKVKEHLMFQARLRLGKDIPKAQRVEKVQAIIAELGLTKCQNTIIGGTRSRRGGISGGERKRLAFASEILTNPPVLFCDEPTSGLDSFMAVQTIEVLKKMVSKGKTVVCTIHQPSSQVFELFDDLCLMANGRVAYMGPVKNARAFFEAQGYPCPQNFNPADHYIRVLAMIPGKEKQHKERMKKICRAYNQSAEKKTMIENVGDAVDGDGGVDGSATQELVTKTPKDADSEYPYWKPSEAYFRYKSTWCQQFDALLWRSFMGNLREPLLVPVRLMQTIVISVITGLVYYQTKLEGSTGIQNVTGLLFLFVTNMTFQYAFAAINVFCEELPIFLREHFSGVYRVDAYYLAKMVSELPQYIVFPFLFTTILYFMAGLEPNAAVFFTMCGINILSANIAVSLGYMLSCMFANINIVLSISPAVVLPFMLFGGFYINMDTVPAYFSWLQVLSYFKYTYEAIAINQFRHIEYIPGCSQNSTCPATGLEVLQSLSINPDLFGLDIVILVIMIVAMRLIGFFALLIRTYVRND